LNKQTTAAPNAPFLKPLRLLAREDHPRFYLCLFLGVAGGFAELVGVAAIYPFIALLSRPELAHAWPALGAARAVLGLDGDRPFLLAFGAFSLVVFLLSTAFMLVRQVYTTRFAIRQTERISVRLLRSYLNRPYRRLLDGSSADHAKSVIGESTTVAYEYLLSWITVFCECFIIAALSSLVVYASPLSGLLTVAGTSAVAGAVLVYLRARVGEFGRQNAEANGRRFEYCLEALQSFKEIKAADAEAFFWRKFQRPASRYAETFTQTIVAQILPSPTIQATAVVTMIALAMIFIATGHPASEIVPLLSVFAAAGFRLMPSLSRLSVALALTRQHESIVENVASVLAEDPAEPAVDNREMEFRKTLALEDLRFSFVPGKPVLAGASFSIPRGAFVALAGGSGAGKTTLADVLMGLLEAQSGRVLVDGKPLTPADMPAWRRRIGYIPQSLFLFDDSIAANIAFAVPTDKIDRARVAEAAKQAQLEDLIASLPEGIDAEIGERGSKLSGGQRQRLGIARALYRDPDLLIMDESTSALDGITEGEILATLKNLKGRKTILVIAHRPTTVRDADSIVLLKDGRVADAGRYEDLAARDAHFAALMSHEGSR